ncbi:hypothetical protein KUTeg_005740 [Tegillarca granosa]|uniref:Transcription initiation factor TFIID component TAF4 C-terminal domain-containing protein n=1 Tax=Tegillarca granosa TaxID=220873 RepID=A0ABQ9FM20_TEGGR|nr:hypothetical protein KUTeg_005740 [Tegillarca granosa]
MSTTSLQQAEIERTRQQEANETALAAIGPRKKRKTDFSESSQSNTGVFCVEMVMETRVNLQQAFRHTIMSLRPRIKRVTIKDMLLFMEQDRAMSKSQTLYKTFFK